MKNLIVFFFLSYLLAITAHAQDKQFLKLFENKKITTLREGLDSSGQKKDSTSNNISGVKVQVGESRQTDKKIYEISIKKQKIGWEIDMLALKISMTIEGDGQKTVYDSDNIFERDQMGDLIGKRYDPYIKKPVKISYDAQGNPSNKEPVNKGFEEFWGGNSPIFRSNQLWQSRVVFPPLMNVTINQGVTWNDTVKVKNDTYLLAYKIEKVENGRVWIKVTGKDNTVTRETKTLSRSKFTDLGSVYEALLEVDTTNFLIIRADVIVTTEMSFSISNNSAIQQTITKYTITNTVTDLKK